MANQRITAEHCAEEHSYFRFGLYLYSPQFGHENICDVHLMWRAPHATHLNSNFESRDPETLKSIGGTYVAWYSRPNDSSQITTHRRSRLDMEDYVSFKNLHPELDISSGGEGMAVAVGNWPQATPKTCVHSNNFHLWLFGPLLLEQQPHGTLFLELNGPFRRDGVFRPLQLRGSTYHEGSKDFIPEFSGPNDESKSTSDERGKSIANGLNSTAELWQDKVVEAYNHRVAATYPIYVPPHGKRWQWTVESHFRNVPRFHANTGLKGLSHVLHCT